MLDDCERFIQMISRFPCLARGGKTSRYNHSPAAALDLHAIAARC